MIIVFLIPSNKENNYTVVLENERNPFLIKFQLALTVSILTLQMKSVFTLLHIAFILYLAYFICLIFLIKFPSSCVPAVTGSNIVLKANIASRLILQPQQISNRYKLHQGKKFTLAFYITPWKIRVLKLRIMLRYTKILSNIITTSYNFKNRQSTFNVFLRWNLNTGLNSKFIQVLQLGGLFCAPFF